MSPEDEERYQNLLLRGVFLTDKELTGAGAIPAWAWAIIGAIAFFAIVGAIAGV